MNEIRGEHSRRVETPQEGSQRREEFARHSLESILKDKRNRKGNFCRCTIALTYENGVLSEVSVSDSATYR